MGIKNPPPEKLLLDLKRKAASVNEELERKLNVLASWHQEQMLQIREGLQEIIEDTTVPLMDEVFGAIVEYLFELVPGDPCPLFDEGPIDYNLAVAWCRGESLEKAPPERRKAILELVIIGLKDLPLPSAEEAIMNAATGVDQRLEAGEGADSDESGQSDEARELLEYELKEGMSFNDKVAQLPDFDNLHQKVRDAILQIAGANTSVSDVLLYRKEEFAAQDRLDGSTVHLSERLCELETVGPYYAQMFAKWFIEATGVLGADVWPIVPGQPLGADPRYMPDGRPWTTELNSDLEKAGVSVRVRTRLKEGRDGILPILTYRDLVKKTEAELLSLGNFGRKSLNEIKKFLTQRKLYLGWVFE